MNPQSAMACKAARRILRPRFLLPDGVRPQRAAQVAQHKAALFFRVSLGGCVAGFIDDLDDDGHSVGRSGDLFGRGAGRNEKTERVKHV